MWYLQDTYFEKKNETSTLPKLLYLTDTFVKTTKSDMCKNAHIDSRKT